VYISNVSTLLLAAASPSTTLGILDEDLNGNEVSTSGIITDEIEVTEAITDPPTAAITDANDGTQKITISFNKRVKNGTDKNIYFLSKNNGTTWNTLAMENSVSITEGADGTTVIINYPELAFTGGDILKVMINGLVDLKDRTTTPAMGYIIGPYTAKDKTFPRSASSGRVRI
jgi:hypothetical protein